MECLSSFLRRQSFRGDTSGDVTKCRLFYEAGNEVVISVFDRRMRRRRLERKRKNSKKVSSNVM